MKRTSKREDWPDSSRHHNHSITTSSASKIPLPRQSTLIHFRRHKPLLELPTIFPIHNSTRHKRYMDSFCIDSDTTLNLIGTKFMRKLSRQKKQIDSGEAVETRNEKPLLERQESHKHNFLDQILINNNIAAVYFIRKEKVKVFVDEGNNSRLVKELMRRRTNIKLTSSKKDANIVWTQFCDWQWAAMGSIFTETDRKNRQFPQHFSENRPECRTEQMENKIMAQRSRQLVVQELRMHNHLKNHYEISDKKCLFKNIKKWCRVEKVNQHDIIPKTYHIDGNETEIPSQDICNKQQFWIVKPGEDTNRGIGITVQQGRDNIIKAVRQLASYGKSSLIQEYIDPLLYKNRKFDIRCYALVTSICGNLKVYWYREGYIRTCCREFNYDPTNLFGHLTNDAVQKKHKDYGKYEPYNKLSFTDLEIFLKSKDISYTDTIARMKQLAFISIKSAQDRLKAEKNMFSFQIFGYDFLIDSKGKLWLIEINTNPCLQFSGSLLSRVIWHMVENSLAIAIDPLLMQLPQSYNSWRQKMDKIYEDNKFQCII